MIRMNSNKIIVLLTPRYISLLNRTSTDTIDAFDQCVEDMRKIRTEFDYVSSMMYNRSKENAGRIIVLFKDVKMQLWLLKISAQTKLGKAIEIWRLSTAGRNCQRWKKLSHLVTVANIW